MIGITDMAGFLIAYSKKDDLIDRLGVMYEWTDRLMKEDKDRGIEFVHFLVKHFYGRGFHISEIKTVLVISKPFKFHDLIQKDRGYLFDEYLRRTYFAELENTKK